MAEMQGWPTDGAEGSVSSEARWRAMARLWAPSGVVPGFGGELAPTLGSGVINVAAGAAWVDGHYTELTTPAAEASTANGLLVVRFTPADNLFELVYRDGATTPTQSDATWELPIARMTAGVMTDLRRMTGDSQVRLGHVLLAAASANIDFADIPQTFNHLRLIGSLRGDAAAANVLCLLRFNGDSATNYDTQTVRGSGTTASAAWSTAASGVAITIPAASAAAVTIGPVTVDIPTYRGSGRRNALLTSGWNAAASGTPSSGDVRVDTAFGTWRNGAAINRVTLAPGSGNLAAGSTATLYGIL